MTNERDRKKKSFGERVDELVKDVLEALESLVTPEPELIPIPVRGGQRPYRR